MRQELLARLREGPGTLRELARGLDLRDREAAEHLRHALRSVGPTERLVETPPACLACGFTFRKRERLDTPGRCPLCKSERIRPAVFSLERVD